MEQPTRLPIMMLHLANFSCDATPPLGHPLCGGWILPVRGVDDPLFLKGVVLLGHGKPIVLAGLDWCGLRNEAFFHWQKALAEAAHTTPERVALHCVHPHNAPFADLEAERLIAAAPQPTSSLNLKFYQECVDRSVAALKAGLPKAKPFDRVGFGSAVVQQVASNRRVIGENGKVLYTRTSATKDEKARAAPEGLIDPTLRTLSFWQGMEPLAALHFYATHPMSYYGDGRVSADFCGLAREKFQAEHPKVHQVYFTGAAGNITAGKYNDGAKGNRDILRDRIHTGLAKAWKSTTTEVVKQLAWRVEPVKLPPRAEPSFTEAISQRDLADVKQSVARRNNCAFQLAWLKRLHLPLQLASLHVNGEPRTLHLPGEPFIEFQLAALKLAPRVCVAGYGDDGPGYLLTAEAYAQGGYEPTVALTSSAAEPILRRAIQQLLIGN